VAADRAVPSQGGVQEVVEVLPKPVTVEVGKPAPPLEQNLRRHRGSTNRTEFRDRLARPCHGQVFSGRDTVDHVSAMVAELLASGRGISRPMAALGVVGLAVAAPYALDQIQIQLASDLATDPHSAGGREHRTEMAIAALSLPLIALVAALRARGFRLVACTAGIGAVVFGAASALLPEQASSPGVAWGTGAMVGGILFVAVAEFEARREFQRPRGQFPTTGTA